MKQTVNSYQFVDSFALAGRGDQFSRAGLFALFDYFDQLEQDTGEEMELDVVAICCDWAEYADLADWARDYFSRETWLDELGLDGDATDEETEAAAREYVQANGQLIEFSGGVIVSSF